MSIGNHSQERFTEIEGRCSAQATTRGNLHETRQVLYHMREQSGQIALGGHMRMKPRGVYNR